MGEERIIIPQKIQIRLNIQWQRGPIVYFILFPFLFIFTSSFFRREYHFTFIKRFNYYPISPDFWFRIEPETIFARYAFAANRYITTIGNHRRFPPQFSL